MCELFIFVHIGDLVLLIHNAYEFFFYLILTLILVVY